MQNVNLTKKGRVYFCRSLGKNCARGWFIWFPTLSPSILSARHRPPALWLVDRPAADLEACCWLERRLHVEWTLRFSFSISICKDKIAHRDTHTHTEWRLWHCKSRPTLAEQHKVLYPPEKFVHKIQPNFPPAVRHSTGGIMLWQGLGKLESQWRHELGLRVSLTKYCKKVRTLSYTDYFRPIFIWIERQDIQRSNLLDVHSFSVLSGGWPSNPYVTMLTGLGGRWPSGISDGWRRHLSAQPNTKFMIQTTHHFSTLHQTILDKLKPLLLIYGFLFALYCRVLMCIVNATMNYDQVQFTYFSPNNNKSYLLTLFI